MPYVPGATTQGNSSLLEVKDIYKSSNVFVNFVPVALYNNEEGTEAAVLSQINSPFYEIDSANIVTDGEEDPKLVGIIQHQLIADGKLTQEELNLAKDASPTVINTNPPVVVSPSPPPGPPAPPPYSDDYQLTPNTTLGMITKKPNVVFEYAVAASMGLTVDQVVENLRYLTINCIEPIKAQYSNMFVTNSFRTVASSSSTSLHPRGMAFDMQFSNISKSDYYNIALWIKDNIAYNRLLLEFKTYGSKLPWIHVSITQGDTSKGVFTYMNDRKISDGLAQYAHVG